MEFWESDNYFKHYDRIYQKRKRLFLEFESKNFILKKLFIYFIFVKYFVSQKFFRTVSLKGQILLHSSKKKREGISVLDVGGGGG